MNKLVGGWFRELEVESNSEESPRTHTCLMWEQQQDPPSHFTNLPVTNPILQPNVYNKNVQEEMALNA